MKEEKLLLRQKMLKERMRKTSIRLCGTSDIIHNYTVIALYLPIRGEIDLFPVIEKLWENDKKVLLPRVLDNKDMIFCSYAKGDQLISSSMGIKEPVTEAYQGIIDLFFVPGLAFGRDGSRLGYGAGFYDRFFIQHPQGTKIGVCYFDDLLNTVPTEPHDIMMDYIMTEEGVFAV